MNERNTGRRIAPVDSVQPSKVPYGDVHQIMEGIFGSVSLLKEQLERLLREVEQINYDMQLTTSICTRCAVDPKAALSCLQKKAYVREQALVKIAAHLRLYGFFQGETQQLLAEIDADKELAAILPYRHIPTGPAANSK
ncbi:hypothetical protein QR46_0281 [Giardia duodenalis assemblage B]|uniref:Uncharacterized protein n=2 Tax=Giardia intestinalis TaxID=5741 RepID=A0A132P044_GIAIN|nr:Hypothetical protein GSB_150993 [Giardia intestinalis]KWX15699.1 hypothetical protein QR46_0281 [Giardia intestinalis assemblage B]